MVGGEYKRKREEEEEKKEEQQECEEEQEVKKETTERSVKVPMKSMVRREMKEVRVEEVEELSLIHI